ncbi:hypothetical protein [Sorangium sp. So ce854]|uniref:hypothetical protein n=1 Tax=Sorangium sp. So ce854 TaxID=3133322 RepID=UPI003F60A815
MQERDWEEAFKAFEANDVHVDEAQRAVSEYAPYDDAEYLRPNMQKEATREKIRAAGRKSTSYLVSELMASHLDGIGEHGEALAIRLRTLPRVPRWSPHAASTALAGVALDVLRTGQPAAAERFARRALRWDPTHPPALVTLAEASLLGGHAGEAFGILEYLDGIKWPKELGREPLTKLAKEKGIKKPASVTPYAPDPASLVQLDREEASRALFVPVLGSAERARRYSAIAATMSGRFALAHRIVAALTSRPVQGMGVDRAREASWIKAVADLVARLPPGDEAERALYARIGAARDHKALAAIVDELREKGDVAGLRAALLDPQTAIRKDVERALAELVGAPPMVSAFDLYARSSAGPDFLRSVTVLPVTAPPAAAKSAPAAARKAVPAGTTKASAPAAKSAPAKKAAAPAKKTAVAKKTGAKR